MAAGIAPRRISRVLLRARPRLMKSPRPPAPMNADRVAMPTPMTVAVRIPATIIGRASGISTMKSRCGCVNPRPWAASMTSPGRPRTTRCRCSARWAGRRRGSGPRGQAVRRSRRRGGERRAWPGWVWSGRCLQHPAQVPSVRAWRVIQIPRGRPISTAAPVEMPVSIRCSSVLT